MTNIMFDTLTLRRAKGNQLFYFVLSLSLAVALFQAVRGSSGIEAASISFVLLVCSLTAAWALLGLIRPGPEVKLDERGIYDRRLRVGVIRWPDIARGELRTGDSGLNLDLELYDPSIYTARLNPLKLMAAKADLRELGSWPHIDLSTLSGATAEEVEAILRSRLPGRYHSAWTADPIGGAAPGGAGPYRHPREAVRHFYMGRNGVLRAKLMLCVFGISVALAMATGGHVFVGFCIASVSLITTEASVTAIYRGWLFWGYGGRVVYFKDSPSDYVLGMIFPLLISVSSTLFLVISIIIEIERLTV